MAKGIVRKIDELGRITLPMEVRRSLEIKGGDRVGLYLEGQVIKIYAGKDVFAGMTRPIDELGRVTLPIELRRTLGIAEKRPS